MSFHVGIFKGRGVPKISGILVPHRFRLREEQGSTVKHSCSVDGRPCRICLLLVVKWCCTDGDRRAGSEQVSTRRDEAVVLRPVAARVAPASAVGGRPPARLGQRLLDHRDSSTLVSASSSLSSMHNIQGCSSWGS